MTSRISEGIKITAEGLFQRRKEGMPIENIFKLFTFDLNLLVENFNSYPVQIFSGHLFILDSSGCEITIKTTHSDTPIVLPGMSSMHKGMCILTSEIGKVKGEYLMKNMETLSLFTVKTPELYLEVPHLAN